MKLRKLFAGVAAAATMLGGLALGATTANAADSLITLNGAEAGHTYTAYKIGDYTSAEVKDGKLTSVSVDTVDGWNDAVTKAVEATDKKSVPDPYKNNPVAYVASWDTLNDSAALREFAQALQDTVKDDKTLQAKGVSADQVADEGWYLVTDSYQKTYGEAYGSALLVGTQVTVNGTAYTQLKDQPLGTVNVKPDTVPVGKTVSTVKDKDGSQFAAQQIGEDVYYTLTSAVPNNTGVADPSFKFEDHLSVNFTYKQIDSITINGEALENPAQYVTAETHSPTAPNNGTDITVDLSSVIKNYNFNDKIVVKYTATLNQYAVLAPSWNTNDVKVNYNGKETDKVAAYVYTGQLQLEKHNAQNESLNGAKFKVYAKDGNGYSETPLKFESSYTVGIRTNYRVNADAKQANADVVTVNSEKGEKTILEGLEGDYKIVETEAPAGYSDNFLPTFYVNVHSDENGTKVTLTQDLNKLATEKDGTVTVVNVKNVTELPKTGAAGIAMFVVLAALLGGAAVTVYTKSRSTKRALNA